MDATNWPRWSHDIPTAEGHLNVAAVKGRLHLASFFRDVGLVWGDVLDVEGALELAAALTELAGDIRDDAAGRTWSAELLNYHQHTAAGDESPPA